MISVFCITLSVEGCVKEIEQQSTLANLQKVVFHAGWDSETKTVLQEDGSVWWSPGDEISLFVDNNSTNYKLTSGITEVSKETEFTGEICEGSTYYAIYPYNAETKLLSERTFSVEIPSVQVAAKGSFDKAAMISIASTTDDRLNFKNVCGGVKFSVANEGIERIRFSVKSPDKSNYTEHIAGIFNVSLDEDYTPVCTDVGGSLELVVYAPDYGTFEVGEYYYAVMPVTKISTGISVTYYKKDEAANWNYNEPFEVHRSCFKKLYAKDAELTFSKTFDYERMARVETIIPDDVDRRTLTGIEFHVNDNTQTDDTIDSNIPVYWKLDGTVLHLYTTADVFDIGIGAWGLFANCSSLTKLDLRNFRTADCENFGNMFHGCSRLEEIDLSSFETSAAINMQRMFHDCYKLKSLDLSGFSTYNVTDMGGMFAQCLSLTQLDISSFNTANVTNMGAMFGECEGLISVNIGSFSTDKVTSMEAMFSGCDRLESIDLSKFNTSNVTNMGGMFSDCAGLKALDLSNFDTANVENMANMFYSVRLKSLDLSNFNTSKVTTMNFMFGRCESLKELNISGFTSESLEDASLLISGCRDLQKLDMGAFDLSNVSCSEACDLIMSCSKQGAVRCIETTKKKLQSVMDSATNDRITWLGLSDDINAWTYPQDPDLYYSTDFSKHETVKKLQSATEGRGIDIVLMGDAYSDRMIENGKYDSDMQLAADAIFAKEPFKSYRDYFNVYVVYLVSDNEVVGGSTALGSIGTSAGQLAGYVQANSYPYYRIMATGNPDITMTEEIIIINSDYVSGYTQMVLGPTHNASDDDSNLHSCDYGYGTAHVVVGRGSSNDDETFCTTVAHEMGHSFAKLADEYWNSDSEYEYNSEDWNFNIMRNKYGIYKNVDNTSDSTKVYWSRFLNDSRYKNDVGVYEGGFLYAKGIWRPDENSIMRNGTEFNAPSREAIYNRIHKLAYGDSWQYDYETFVQQDLKNIKSAETKSAKSVSSSATVKRKPLFIMEKEINEDGKMVVKITMD